MLIALALVIHIQNVTVTQVQMDILSVGSSKELFSIERPTVFRGITGVFGRDIRACAQGNQEANSRSSSTSITMPCRGYPATSR